jgi:hypothetical protein
MNIPEAIEVLSEYVFENKPQDITAYDKATKLSIEALKFRLKLEQEDPEITLEPLPGETEE